MTNITDGDRQVLLAGLAEVRKRGLPKLSTLKGGRPHVRQQLFLTRDEHYARTLMGYAMTLHMGRAVSQALIVRLALSRLAAECSLSLKDPVVAARLKAELLAVREEKAPARE